MRFRRHFYASLHWSRATTTTATHRLFATSLLSSSSSSHSRVPLPHLTSPTTPHSARAPPQPLIWIKSGSCHPRGKQEILYSSVIIAGARTTHTHTHLKGGKGKLTRPKGSTALQIYSPHRGTARAQQLGSEYESTLCFHARRSKGVLWLCIISAAVAARPPVGSHSLTHSRSLGYGRSTGRQMRKRGSKWDCS